MNWRRSLSVCLLVLAIALINKTNLFPLNGARVWAAAQSGAVITVNDTSGTTGGSGCTLRDAITAANTNVAVAGCAAGAPTGQDRIELPTNATITLTVRDNSDAGFNGLPTVTSSIEIRGNGTTIERSSAVGTPDFRLFHIASGGVAWLQDVHLRNGLALGSNGTSGGTAQGGAVLVAGIFSMQRSAISNCEARGGNGTAGSGGAALGGAIATSNIVLLRDTTISGNRAIGGTGTTNGQGLGGGLYARSSTGEVSLGSCTFSDNTASQGGGLYLLADGSGGMKRDIVSSIFANSSAGAADAFVTTANGGSFIATGSLNLVESNAAGVNALTGVTVTGDPKLDVLKVQGPGNTPTHALLAGSPAIDRGGGFASTDQRGWPRPNYPPNTIFPSGGNGSDIGAYEKAYLELGTAGGSFTLDQPVNVAFSATPTGVPYSYSASGTLPPGLTLASDGTLSGTPTQLGTYTFNITATVYGDSVTKSYTFSVVCPTISLGSVAGSVNPPYAVYEVLTPVGGAGNYTFSATGLPPGLTFSAMGVLSGVVVTPGTYSYTLSATDARGCGGSQTNNLTVNNPRPVAGRVGGLKLPGYNATAELMRYVEFARTPAVQTYPALTVEAWVKLTNPAGRYDILARSPLFFSVQNGKPALRLNGLPNTTGYQASAALPTGAWTHVAATWNGSQVEFFINGVSSGTTAAVGSLLNETQPLSLGYCNTGSGPAYGFLGELDDVRLWRVARSSAQIAASYAQGLVGNEAGLEAYWRFDEMGGVVIANATNSVVKDASGHGLDGTLKNGVGFSRSDNFITNKNTTYNGKLFAYIANSANLTYSITGSTVHGALTLDAATGVFSYAPATNYIGNDNFMYVVTYTDANSNKVTDFKVVDITVTPTPPTIGTYPNASLNAGSSTTVTPSVAPSGATSVTVASDAAFQGTLSVNATTGVVTVTNAQPGGSFPVTVYATNAGGTTNTTFTLNVCAPPAITLPPISTAVLTGQGAVVVFRVQATGTNPNDQLSYQWRKGGLALTDSNTISGAQTAALTLSEITMADAGAYDVVITGSCGTTTSPSATLFVGQGPGVLPQIAGSLLINEFRFSGPGGVDDWYVELYNNTDQPMSTSGMKLKWANATQTGVITLTPVNPRTIAPRGYFLIGGSAYSLGALALRDVTVATLGGIGQLGGVQLCDATGVMLDAAGVAAPFSEGTPVAALGVTAVEHAWVRKTATNAGKPQDTDNNQNDFVLVATTTELSGAKLGAPSPQFMGTPAYGNAQLPMSLFEPRATLSSFPNFQRVLGKAVTSQGTYDNGVFYLRRTFTNNTPYPITKLRAVVYDITDGSVAGQANIRVLDALNASIGDRLVRGLTVASPAQTNGGGLNSSLTINFAPGESIPVGGTISVQFKLGVKTGGSYRFFVNLEATNEVP